MLANLRLISAISIAAIMSLEGAQWYFMPNFGGNFRGFEKLADGDEPFYTVVPKPVHDYLEVNDVTKSITVTGTGKGIQCVAETLAHENNHLLLYGRLGNKTDADGDGIADSDESTLQGVETLVDNPDTYNMASYNTAYETNGDNEIRCRKAELNVTNYHPRRDWANPGCQSKTQFGPNP